MGNLKSSNQSMKQRLNAAAESSDKLSDHIRELLGYGSILVREPEPESSRLYAPLAHADELQEALSKNFFPGPGRKVDIDIAYLTDPDTHDTHTLARFSILPEHAAMIANGVERTQKGERRGIANTLVLEAKGPQETDAGLSTKAFELLANGQSLAGVIGRKAANARSSTFGELT